MIRGLSRGVFAFIALLVVMVLIASMWVFGWGFFARATADFRGETEQKEITNADGEYRIAAYEQFFDMCAAVQAAEGRIANLEKERETADESRRAQLDATLTALRNQRVEAITEYNAEARKEATVAQFRASDLPGELNPEETTECTVE